MIVEPDSPGGKQVRVARIPRSTSLATRAAQSTEVQESDFEVY